MKLMQVPASSYFNTDAGAADRSKWSDVRPYKSTEQIDNVMPFANWVAIFGRESGVQRLWLMVPGEGVSVSQFIYVLILLHHPLAFYNDLCDVMLCDVM
jgi:hypothetical protein